MKRAPRFLLCLLAVLPMVAASQERGALLVATERISDDVFAETVILLLHYDTDGAIGVAINRPTWVSTREVFPGLDYLYSYRGGVFHGGPLAQATVLVLSRRLGRDVAGPPVVDGVYMSSDPALLEAGFSASRDDQSELRFYAGHASWRAGQLEDEIEAGAWRVVPGSASAVFDAEPATLWRRLVIGGDELKVEQRATVPPVVASR